MRPGGGLKKQLWLTWDVFVGGGVHLSLGSTNISFAAGQPARAPVDHLFMAANHLCNNQQV